MRKPIMGIDLGTTNSCVAIPTDAEGEAGVVVVTDDFDRFTTPSVVWITEEGDYVVGHRAKLKMGTEPPPIAFIKHYMGKDHRVRLRDEALSPEQVSARILMHLRNLVKERLGDDIDQAVITIPARFELAGQQATVEAARRAGLDVLTTMPEPVAAALAYGLQDAEDNLKIFCYDLGGGTFDATVMTKDPESGVEVMAFDGDPHLGGYHFDKLLAQWVLERLNQKYALDMDWEDRKDQIIFQKLMHLAEKAKIALSTDPEYTILQPEAFEDHNGEPVDIRIDITRKIYETLVEELVERTMDISEQAITRAGLTPDQVDRVIMVGGSSRIPLAQRRLAERLSCSPELSDPDRIVARGAAIKAGTMVGSRVQGLIFLSEIPRTCALDTFDIFGQVTLEPHANLAVYLERHDGDYDAETITDEEGTFRFIDVELMEETENGFDITIGSRDEPLLSHSFEVIQQPDAVETVLETNFVTQTISLMLASGMHPVLEEGARIPADTTNKIVPLYTQWEGQTSAKFDVYQGNHNLGEVRLDGLPPGLQPNSEVLAKLSLGDDLVVSVTATLVKNSQMAQASFKIPRPKLPSVEELSETFSRLRDEFADAIETIHDNMLKMKHYGEGQRYIKEITQILESKPCDLPHLYSRIDEFAVFIMKLGKIDVLEPSWDAFLDKIEAARNNARMAEERFEKAKRARFEEAIDGAESFGRQAYQDRNKKAWKHANERINQILEQIEDMNNEVLRMQYQEMYQQLSSEQQEYVRQQQAEKFCQYLHGRIVALDAEISASPETARFKPEVQTLVHEVNTLNPVQPDQTFTKGRKIEAKIDELEKKIRVGIVLDNERVR